MHEPKGQFTLEITTAALCNLDCTYCFEGAKTNKRRLDTEQVAAMKKRIYDFIDSDFFKDNYESLNISFWGGEPTLNQDLIINIIQEYQHIDNVEFHIYTNAYERRRLDKILDNINMDKLNIQISYDGRDINDVFRLTSTGKSSADKVLENLEYFAKKGAHISLKSTVPLQTMRSLYRTWKDFEQMYEKYNSIGPNVSISYAPTIDYVDDLPRERAEELVQEFREQMLKVAAEEIKFVGKHQRHLMTWFNGSDTKFHCAAGAHMHAIDVDGNSYACHGVLYSPNKEKLQVSNVVEDNFINRIEETSKTYGKAIERVSDTCKNCVATTCMICPAASYDMSKNDDFESKWTDRWVNNMCGFFKAFGEIDRTVQSHLDGDI